MSPTPPPDVDRRAAAHKAIERRRARSALKRSLAYRVVQPQAVLALASADPESDAATLRITDFLGALPGIGATKRTAILDELGISPVHRLGGLGKRQRVALEAWLEKRFVAPQSRTGLSRLLVLAGPTAVGKGTVAAHIREHHPEIALSVSATTRPPRPTEVDGVHYFFVDDAEFDRLVANNELLEWATVHNRSRYGTPRGPVERAAENGELMLLEIDLQGARQVRASMPEARLVFLAPPSWDELVNRLVGRGTEDEEERTRRLETAKVELASAEEFDEIIVNDEVPRAALRLVELMRG